MITAMKVCDSGMPDEAQWSSFFNPPQVLAKLGLTERCRDVAEFGCGYGTFTVAAARIVRGTVWALDIEPEMIAATRAKAKAEGLGNIKTVLRDFVADGTGLPDASVDYVMLFNILHAEQPRALLREVHRILRPQGLAAVMHWNYDPSTPRGPSLTIRPRPNQCRAWGEAEHLMAESRKPVDLPPYHYGLVLRRP